MTTLEIVLSALADIAPEVDVGALDVDADVREEVDLDSMDFLNLVQQLAERTGVEVPERDYPKVASVAAMATYIDGRMVA